jgi:5-bromo-4-chloroindolyl phosphate hydrolysis protein
MSRSISPSSRKRCCKTPLIIFREISNFSGNGIRILFSPLSKILSIHCFNLNPYGITDRKYYNEINGYVEQQMYQVINEEHSKAKVNVFLKTKKNICAKKRDLGDFEIVNSIIPIVTLCLTLY